MKCSVAIICLLLSTSLLAQDLKGKWKGMIYSSAAGDSTKIELVVRKNKKNEWAGTTTTRFGAFNFVTAVISVQYDSVSNSVFLRERTIIDKDVWDYMTLTLNEYNLKFEGTGKLVGSIYCFRTLPPRVGMEGACPGPMQIYLTRQ
jgi:hypothetical protein